MWVSWVAGARRGDASAREELVTYFTPFVHGVLISHVAAHVANEQVKPLLDDALRRLAEVKTDNAFGATLLDMARKRAQALARSPGSTLEMIGGGATVTEGKKVISKLRQLPEATRERLVFRLLEGIPGTEIAEVTGAPVADVRGDLERGITALVRELNGQTLNLAGDNYLFSMVGNPPPALVPLENQLTVLRHDPAAHDPGKTDSIGGQLPDAFGPDITPTSGERYDESRQSEGKRPTGEQSVIVDLTPEPLTIPGRVMPEEATNLLDVPRPLANAAGGYERTQHATDLPAAATQNPFANQPGTLPANDLPAAARVERQSKPRTPTAALGDGDGPPTEVRPPPRAAMEATRARPPEPSVDDSTAPRGIPISALVGLADADTGSLTPSVTPVPMGQDWRGALSDARTVPSPAQRKSTGFSMTRGTTPFVMAVVFFAFFIAIAYVNIRGTEIGVRRGWNLVPVTVAAQNIPEGAVVDFDMISTRQVPEQFVTASVVKPDSAQYIVSQRIMVPVQAGDPLLWTQFETARATERLSRRVNKRGRAYTLDARTVTAVGGWVRPGDHVDLVISVRDTASNTKIATTTLQNIMVLATGKLTPSTNFGTIKGNAAEYSNVSVLALPEEIEILALMKEKANYRMLLRNDEDYDSVEVGRSTPDTLINGERVAVLQKKRFQTIQLIRSAPKPASDAQSQPKH